MEKKKARRAQEKGKEEKKKRSKRKRSKRKNIKKKRKKEKRKQVGIYKRKRSDTRGAMPLAQRVEVPV